MYLRNQLYILFTYHSRSSKIVLFNSLFNQLSRAHLCNVFFPFLCYFFIFIESKIYSSKIKELNMIKVCK